MTITYDLNTAPESWAQIKLRHILTLNPPVPTALRSSQEEVSFLPMELIGEDGSLDLSRTRPVRDVLTGYSYYANGDVLFAKVTPCFENGKGALVRGLPADHGFGTTEVTTLRPGPNLDQAFLGYLIRTDRFRQSGIAAMTGAGGLKRVPDEHVREFRIALPPLTLQEQIADYLDRETTKIGALIAKQEQLIATLREDRTATITQAVTKGLDPAVEMTESDVEWLGKAPAHWSRQRFSTLYSESDDRLGDGNAPELLSVSIHLGVRPRRELVTDKDARADDFTKYKLCRPGDIVLNRMRAFQGGLGVAGQSGIVSPDYMVMKILPTAVSDYLGYLMKTPWFVEQMTSLLRGIGGVDQGNARTPRINPRDLGGIEIMLPPKAEQLGIVESLNSRLAKVDNLLEKAEEVIATLREYRSALITDAVTGKIDVRGAV